MAGSGSIQATVQAAAAARSSFLPFHAPEGDGERSAGAAGPIEILLVEDSPADVRFFREALHLAEIRHHLSIVTNGEEALSFLRRKGPHAGVPRPEVIVLDLKLPRVSGHAVLGTLKLDPDLRSIPVVVLTSSHAPRDQERSYDLDAEHYVTKPIGLDVLAGELKIIEALAGRRRA
jgi:chemotaxis family two-component system response regulator Rcp1